ncbi:hypothetical protein [Streptomyces coeruleorubidus]|uniref:Uncharacterized protein n=1 Tax=Streptomyces coeruleorubidus TaxID=116188 RepID=A0A5J6HYL6_STRC4|nr:hypothetical protein [Streptomyces coeruleorubidus]QEV23994.1 hypothetical protein CP976_07430 [Streptomyces coeruleorubidus]GGT85514.1 hypothetical protein GCM10010256_52020 [Streptomyces coeruleorubidus]
MNGTRVGAGNRGRLYASTTDTFDEQADLDYIAIEYALNGEPVKLTVAEKIHAARILDGRGYSDKAIGERVRSDTSTIASWRDNGWKPGGTHPKARKREPRPEPKCGEPRMYRRHLRNGEAPCDACRAANAAADRRYRLTGSQKAAA